MGHQIVQQPNGKFAIWSTISDGFIAIDCTRQEIVEYYVQKAAEGVRKETEEIFEQLAKGELPYFQFTRTWEGLLELRKELHEDEPDFKDALDLSEEPNPAPIT